MKKPTSSDPEQRRHDTRVSRFQSGLPPEEGEDEVSEDRPTPKKQTEEPGGEKGSQGEES